MADVLVLHGNRPDLPMVVEERHLEMIREICSGKVYYYEREEEALKDGIDAEVLFVWGGSGKMPEAWCAASNKLQWVNSFSAGVNPLMDGPISELPIRLTNAKGIHGKTMGVTTMGYIISFLRQFPRFMAQQKAHVWEKRGSQPLREPTGLTVGIIGAGSIGSEVARLCKVFDMTVLGVKRKVFPLENYDKVYSNTEMDEVLAVSDFVILLTPLTDETRGLIGAKQLAKMKSDAVLINIARGPVVDTAALVDALQRGVIAGAALDAVDPEPLNEDSPLWNMENVIITPHCSADSTLYMDRAMAQFCENLQRFQKGEPLFNEIDLKRKY
jgi:D-2-hydroxyacid dehydrogenase (NADP+)